MSSRTDATLANWVRSLRFRGELPMTVLKDGKNNPWTSWSVLDFADLVAKNAFDSLSCSEWGDWRTMYLSFVALVQRPVVSEPVMLDW